MSDPRTLAHLPPLTALKSFEAAARHGSFTAAAAELFVTHGAVSRQVKILEEWAGKRLFHRHGKRIALTDAGRQFSERIGDAFQDIALAAQSLRNTSDGPWVLCVDALPTFAMRWLLPRLARFQFRHPKIELRLVTSDVPLSQLAPLSFDVAVRRSGGIIPSGFESNAFLSEREVPVMSPEFASRHVIRQPADLVGVPLLVADTRPGAWDRWFAAAGQEAAMSRANLQRFEHFYLALQAAMDGLGVALGPLPLVDGEIEAGRLIVPVSGPYLSSAPYCWNVPSVKRQDPVVGAFVAWLEEEGAIVEMPKASRAV